MRTGQAFTPRERNNGRKYADGAEYEEWRAQS